MYQERLARLENDKESLVLQVSGHLRYFFSALAFIRLFYSM